MNKKEQGKRNLQIIMSVIGFLTLAFLGIASLVNFLIVVISFAYLPHNFVLVALISSIIANSYFWYMYYDFVMNSDSRHLKEPRRRNTYGKETRKQRLRRN